MKKIDTDMNYVKDLYLSEKSVDQIATIIGVKKGVVEQRARESGLLFSALRPPISPSRGVLKIDIPEDDIIALFESGWTKRAIAQRYGVNEGFESRSKDKPGSV